MRIKKTERNKTREIFNNNRNGKKDIKNYYGKLPSDIVPLGLKIILFV